MVAQQERNEGNKKPVQPSLSQSSQHVGNIENSQERRLVLDPQQVTSPNQAIPIQPQEVDSLMCPIFRSHRHKEMKSSAKQAHVFIVNFVELKVWCLQQNSILQQAIQEVHHDPNIHGTLSEQQENIGQILNELAKLKLTLKQGFVLIDETCAKHAPALEGLQSFAGAQIGANQRIHETLQKL